MAKTRIAIAIAAATALAALTAAPAPAAGEGKPKLRTLSTRADLVTGGDVLVAVDVPRGADAGKVRVRRNGTDVTAAFAPAAGEPEPPRRPRRRPPRRATTCSRPRCAGVGAASLGVFNSPVTGPVFSGPLQAPFFCRTADRGLGPATDGNCSAPEQVAWYYRTTNGSFKPLANPAGPLPADGVETTTRDGHTVDYVVRVESGVIDRSIYRFAVLAPGGVPADGWNRRFVFNFGGGCSAGYEQGSRPIGTALNNPELSQGYATLTGSLNVLGTACNDVLSAEAAQMLKEHAIEALGERPVWTMGQGGSGGSVQQQLIAQNYPGILDGLMPGASFPDGASPDYPDCRLLNAYFATPDGAALSAAQRRAVTGLADADGCLALGAGADVVNAGEGCNESVVPPAQIFDPVTNPDGIRCTVWDSMVNVYGRDPATGYARRTLDNVGVQYGLGALNDGAIGIGAFLDLNEGIGGYDEDGELRAQRSVADPDALATAYRTGRVNRTLGGYRDVPVLDIRSYVDDEINVHQYVNTYRLRARLDAAGGHENQVMWRAKGGSNVNAMNDAALTTLADWMDAIAADDSDRSAAEKVVAAKPADAVDACWIGGQRTNGEARIGAANVCETTYAPHALPADVAGTPARLDRPQVHPEADRLRRLRRFLRPGPARPPRGGLPGRRLRLVEARRRPGAIRRDLAGVRARAEREEARAVDRSLAQPLRRHARRAGRGPPLPGDRGPDDPVRAQGRKRRLEAVRVRGRLRPALSGEGEAAGPQGRQRARPSRRRSRLRLSGREVEGAARLRISRARPPRGRGRRSGEHREVAPGRLRGVKGLVHPLEELRRGLAPSHAATTGARDASRTSRFKDFNDADL